MDNESILEEAKRLTSGPRGADYGPPWEDYTKVADMMNALFHKKLKSPFTCADVPRIMILVKLSRDVNRPKRDNPVDIAGYAWCLHECEEHLRALAGIDKQPGGPVGEGAGISTPSPAGSTPASPVPPMPEPGSPRCETRRSGSAFGQCVLYAGHDGDHSYFEYPRCTCDIPGWQHTKNGYIKNYTCPLHNPGGAATLAAMG